MSKLILSSADCVIDETYGVEYTPNERSSLPPNENTFHNGYKVKLTVDFVSSGDMSNFKTKADLQLAIWSEINKLIGEIEL